MTLPKDVIYSLNDIAGEAKCRCDVAYTSRGLKDPGCVHDLLESVDTIRAHLLSQDASITSLRSAAQKVVLANADLRVRAELAESRLAAADALLRECYGFMDARSIDQRSWLEDLSLCEKIQAHLQKSSPENAHG